ncbi:glutathione peroxidase [Planctobacterium marinum]|uniref:glutathione peroxidase n=1 Tax=Planctobacterium marinum TaxID=1631968 RepID=UPI001E2B3440|nr:glutathione peroxidase [Planctobacterium marinum]MCC2604392.1 glutathione peroxidase [Planctobacterium marinum]
MADNIYQFTVKNNKGEDINLAQYQGKVVLIVNTASKCGFTPQYDGLQALYDEYSREDFEVLAFPCDQFGHQEPGDNEQIEQFCSINFGVKFPLFQKLEVNGKNAAPVFDYLKSEAPGLMGSKSIKWNFTKFLIGKDGLPIKRYAPNTKPESIKSDIEAAIKA